MATSRQTRWLIDEHRRRLDRMSGVLGTMMLRELGRVPSFDEVGADQFRTAMFDRVGVAAQAAVRQTEGYAHHLARDADVYVAGTVPAKLVRDKQARLLDPFNVFGKAMADGLGFDEAVQRARSTVESLASDIIHGSSRQALGFIVEDSGVKWVRALSSKACDWCVALSRVEWESPSDATFGHDNCSCTPVPASSGHEMNRDALEKLGPGDADATYDVRSQRSHLAAARSRANSNARRWESELAKEDSPSRRRRIEARIEDYRAQADWAATRIDELSI